MHIDKYVCDRCGEEIEKEYVVRVNVEWWSSGKWSRYDLCKWCGGLLCSWAEECKPSHTHAPDTQHEHDTP